MGQIVVVTGASVDCEGVSAGCPWRWGGARSAIDHSWGDEGWWMTTDRWKGAKGGVLSLQNAAGLPGHVWSMREHGGSRGPEDCPGDRVWVNRPNQISNKCHYKLLIHYNWITYSIIIALIPAAYGNFDHLFHLLPPRS